MRTLDPAAARPFASLVARLALALLLPLYALGAPAVHAAEGRTVRVPTREGVVIPTYWLQQDQATATVVLLPGGSGGMGKVEASGWPGSSNFLVRSAQLFAAQGFNVAIVARPSDVPALNPALRTSSWHLEDMHQVLQYLRQRSGAPLWLVGTSQGTITAAAVAIAQRDSALVNGVVLTASITNFNTPGAVPRQALDQIKVPVLVVHHAQDACALCRPHEVPLILQGLGQAPAKKLLMLHGGGEATGDPCEAAHFHGFIGMEQAVVDAISAWIRNPVDERP